MPNNRAVLLALISMLFGAAAHAHAALDHASPPVGATVRSSPGTVTLWFTEKIEPAFSSVEVRNAAGARVDAGNSRASGNQLRVSLRGLAPGTYTVTWRVLSVDTHRTQGSFSFRVGE